MIKNLKILLISFLIFNYFSLFTIKTMEQNTSFNKELDIVQPTNPKPASDYLVVTHQKSNRKPRRVLIKTTQHLPSQAEAFKCVETYLLRSIAILWNFHLNTINGISVKESKLQERIKITNTMNKILEAMETKTVTLKNYKHLFFILQMFAFLKSLCVAEYQLIFYEKLIKIKSSLTNFLYERKLDRTLKKLQKLNLKFD